jgi:cytochrome bd-type quinol oxidase subunit 2
MYPRLKGVKNLAFILIGDAASRSRGFTTFFVVVLVFAAWFLGGTVLREAVVKHLPEWRSMKSRRDLAWAVGLGAFGIFVYFFVGVHGLGTVALSDSQVLAIVFVPLLFLAARWVWTRRKAHDDQQLIHIVAALALLLCGVLFAARVLQ